jgi:hypothetical protein
MMGNLTIKGWYTSSDEIPQPTSIVTGKNLRKPEPPTERERVLQSIAQFCEDQKDKA